ncbi:MAG: acetolactate decarboxylase [Caldilineaceae bacterium]|nr:acetolactate decarboxylase [Caldilineaceae bacterium]
MRTIVIAFLSICCLAACALPVPSEMNMESSIRRDVTDTAAPIPVTIAVGAPHVPVYLNFDLAQALGYFAEEGLAVEIQYFEGGSDAAAALKSGAADFSGNAMDHVLEAQIEGYNLPMVMNFLDYPCVTLVVRSDLADTIRSPADLAGRTVGVTRFGSATHTLTVFVAAKAGVAADDFTAVEVGVADMPDALLAGDIDAAMGAAPYTTRLVNAGEATVLMDLCQPAAAQAFLGGGLPFTGLLTRENVLTERPHVVQRVVNVLAKAQHFVTTHSAQEIIASLPAEAIGDDAAAYTEALVATLPAFNRAAGCVERAGLDRFRDLHEVFGTISADTPVDLDALYDNQFVVRWLETASPVDRISLMAGCAPHTPIPVTDSHTLFQTSTLSALESGVYTGEMSIGELKQHGDLGLGTFEALDGEMVMWKGTAYRVDSQGAVHVVDDATITPFAAVTFFNADETTALHATFTCPQLHDYLDARFPRMDRPYAFRIEGSFPSLTVRSVHAQEPPYPPLAEALVGQVVFEQQNISGALVGFRLPAYLAGTNAAGYHFHFISDDRQVGGHVLDCVADAVTVNTDDIDTIQVDLLSENPAGTEQADDDVEPLVVFGAYGTSVAEPWNQAVHLALLAAEAAGDIQYSYVDQIGFAGDIGLVLRTAIKELSPALVVGDAFGNEDIVTAIAQENPDVAFVFGSDEKPRTPNLSTFDSWLQEPAYLAGMLAGGLTQSNRVGIVAGYPEGSVNRTINAFVAGAEAVNPQVDVRTDFINTWYDPAAAGAAAQVQIAAGADVIFGERAGVIDVAAAAGVYAIGNYADQSEGAPSTVVASIIWDMRPALNYVIEQVRNGRYAGQNLVDFSSLAVGGAYLTPLNRAVDGGIPDELAAQIATKAEEIVDGRSVVPMDSSEPAVASKPIVLAALYNLTGAQSELDTPSAQGAQLAVDEANRRGGVLGRPVQLVVEDGGSDPAVLAAKTANILAEHPDVVAFLGLSDSDMVLGAAPVAAVARRIFVTSGATTPELVAQVPDYLFLACFGDNVQAAAASEWAYDELSARTVAILYDADMRYTQGLQRYFAERFVALGGEISSVQDYNSGDLVGLARAVDNLTEADVIFVAAGPQDAPEAARLLRAGGFTAPILGGDGFDSGALWQQYSDIEDVYFTTHAYLGADNLNPTVQAFRERYLAAYPDAQPDAFSALGYDAVNLVIAALAQAGSADPEAVRDALAALEAFEGVTGRISFAPGSPIPTKSVTILAVEAGEYRYVTELTPVSVPAP